MGKNRKKLVEGVVEHGNVNVPKGSFADDEVKVRITMFVDAEVLKGFKQAAGGRGYQTLMNQKLREAWEAGLNERPIAERLGELEAAVFEKASGMYYVKREASLSRAGSRTGRMVSRSRSASMKGAHDRQPVGTRMRKGR